MAKRQFKTESKRVLDLMINSIYTHKEIFLRELISNASDAIDKLYFRSLTDPSVAMSREDFFIQLSADKEARTLTITDNGCGMTKEDLEHNLGVIAHSGSLDFKTDNKAEDIDIIGQFGVGFYSAFMVSDKVTVKTRAFGADTAYVWESSGADGYTIKECEKDTTGTEITLYLKPATDDEQYDEFLDSHRISALVKRYSDYIRYPIHMDCETAHFSKITNKTEMTVEDKILNSMIPLWKKNKSDITEEEYNNFYSESFFDFNKPVKTIHFSAEGTVCYTALLYIPDSSLKNYYTPEEDKGLKLYTNGVMIMDKCPELIADHFAFVRGFVDSPDLSLNISREMLQHDRQLKFIASSINKKIKSELEKMLKNEREKYEKLFDSFGTQIKYGIYSNPPANKTLLQDLIMFHSAAEDKMLTLKEYTESMPEEQKYIYYASGEDINKIKSLPQTERVRECGYDILCLTADIDEFTLKMMQDYDGKEFRSVSGDDLGLPASEKTAEATKVQSENVYMLDFMKNALEGRVKSVKISERLTQHPVCITSEGLLSLDMEKFLNSMPTGGEAKAERVLELNAAHDVFKKLTELYASDQDKLKKYTWLLYNQALLIEGMPLEDPVKFSADICELMK